MRIGGGTPGGQTVRVGGQHGASDRRTVSAALGEEAPQTGAASDGRRYLYQWIAQLRWQRLKPFEKFAQMLPRHEQGLLNYCHAPVRFGVVEAVNGNIRALIRRGRGDKNLRYLSRNSLGNLGPSMSYPAPPYRPLTMCRGFSTKPSSRSQVKYVDPNPIMPLSSHFRKMRMA